MVNLVNPPPRAHHSMGPLPSVPENPGVKTRMCNKYNTAEGCRFGDKCHFAHGERELGKPASPGGAVMMGVGLGRFPGRQEAPPPAGGFGASATAKISVDASLAGAIIGKGGANTKQIRRNSGAKLFIREHESDANLRNIELEGTFEQIKQASAMVGELIVSISATMPLPQMKNHAAAAAQFVPGGNFKTKLCEKFAKGACTFGDRCHFAHGEAELRKVAV